VSTNGVIVTAAHLDVIFLACCLAFFFPGAFFAFAEVALLVFEVEGVFRTSWESFYSPKLPVLGPGAGAGGPEDSEVKAIAGVTRV